MSSTRFIRLSLATALATLTGLTLSVARSSSTDALGDEPVVHFVVDVSGSMGGTKIAEAIEAIKVTATRLDDTTAVGLRSYAGSCNQSGVPPVVPIGLANDDAIIAGADSLRAGGGTPTTAALAEGLSDVRNYGSTGDQRIVLLTDGDTQCGISICDWVKSQDLSDLSLTMYTVGLQVGSAAAADLQCAAEWTGGEYIPAADPDDLADALNAAASGSDKDGDGLPDSWEDNGRQLGSNLFDYTLRDAGATSQRKDLFLRIDSERGARPSDEAIQLVVDAFANAPVSNPDGSTGITLHVSHGPEVTDAESDALKVYNDADPEVDTADWAAISERLSPLQRNYYRLAVSVNWDDWGGVLGQADNIPGQFMVLNQCGSYRTYKIGPFVRRHQNCRASAPVVASTLMHELGHTIGLYHGGAQPPGGCGMALDPDNINSLNDCWHDVLNPYKPNYLSVMSYNYWSEVIGWGIDYSRWGIDDIYVLDENSLSEWDGVNSPNNTLPQGISTFYYCSDGIGRKINVYEPVDWNCTTTGRGSGIEDGRIEAVIDYPARLRASSGSEWLGKKIILTPHDDWQFINDNSAGLLGAGLIGGTNGVYQGGYGFA